VTQHKINFNKESCFSIAEKIKRKQKKTLLKNYLLIHIQSRI